MIIVLSLREPRVRQKNKIEVRIAQVRNVAFFSDTYIILDLNSLLMRYCQALWSSK